MLAALTTVWAILASYAAWQSNQELEKANKKLAELSLALEEATRPESEPAPEPINPDVAADLDQLAAPAN